MVIEAFIGLPRSGKTARLLGTYRQALSHANANLELGATLWLAPTRRAAAEIANRLLTPQLGAVFRPNVLTFDEFAKTVLQAVGVQPSGCAGVTSEPVARAPHDLRDMEKIRQGTPGQPQGCTPTGPAAQRSLLRRIVGELLEEKQLPYFAAIADTSGFLDQVSGLIAELKRQETWPEDLERACQARGFRPRDAELSRIYARYQSLLLKHNWYDAEGLFWSAREALKRGEWGRFETLSLVVVDGFTDFTHNQFEILRLLARKSGRLQLSLLGEAGATAKGDGPGAGRRDLFAKTSGVLNRFQEMPGLSVVVEECAAPAASQGKRKAASREEMPVGLQQIAQHLFRNPLEVPRSSQSEGVEVLAVAGPLVELQMLAARIKRLLLNGVRPREIVVCFRGLAESAGLVDEVFGDAGIPYACDAGLPLSRAPLVKALLALLQCEAEDWPFERLLGVLNSNFFRPTWNEFAGGATIGDVASTLRRMRMHSQRQVVLNALDREAARCEAEAGREEESDSGPEPPGQRERRSAVRAHRLLNRLSQATASLRQSHTIEGWTKVITGLTSEIGLLRASAGDVEISAADQQDHAADRRAWDACLSGLSETARAAQLCPSGTATLTLSQFLHEFTDLLHSQALSSMGNEDGRVRILEAAQVRNLQVPYLFLAGLGERSFPRHAGDDCLYSQSERQVLNEHGLTMGHRTARNQEEMLLFYGVVTRATRLLVLSYPAVGPGGQPLSPSPYLGSVLDLFTPGSLVTQLEEQLDPVPPPDRLLSAADLRVRGMYEALANRPALFSRLFVEPAHAVAARNVLAAVDLNVERFHTPGFSPFEGRLASPSALARLRARYSVEHEFSASQLEGYAQCPFRFFLQQVLRLEPFDAPGDATDYAARGDLVHKVLARLHDDLVEQGLDPDAASELIARRFPELLADELWRYFGASDLERVLGRIELQLVGEWGAAYVEQWQQYHAATSTGFEQRLQPRYLEKTFGRPHSASEQSAMSSEPLVFGSGSNAVRVCGKIDRVDVGVVDGHNVFAVIDYKTGKHRFCREDEIAAGRTLQLPLYTLATEKLQLAGPDARPFQMGYWHIKEQGFAPAFKQRGSETKLEPLPESQWSALKAVLEDIVPRLATGIRSGAFPVFNSDDNCAGQCPYRTVCRVQQIRALPDALGKTWNISGGSHSDDAVNEEREDRR